ncbi:MAG: amidohydrolase family protein [Planctomycetaceae bacterium]|nr:amidohydrolase family protein [Planctomycetaceae bacterium]
MMRQYLRNFTRAVGASLLATVAAGPLAGAAFAAPQAQSMQPGLPPQPTTPKAGEPGGPGLAILTAKALICSLEGQQVQDHAVVLVRDGKIEAVLPKASTRIPEDYEVVDVGERWVMPGMIDLHAHVGGTFDINDAVYLANPGLRAKTAAIPSNRALRMAVAGGVTSILFIPGSATNVGGEGLLMKTALPHYEESVVLDPGSLKVAQWGNPERWVMGVNKTFENYTIREILRRGKAYGQRWINFEAGKGPRPDVDVELEVFRALVAKKAAISVHTQIYQVVLATITIIREELGFEVFIDHGTFDGHLTAPLAERLGVNAILGPRNVDAPNRGVMNWVGSNPERVQGVAAGYQEKGLTHIGFNTDSPVIPQEELSLQAAMAVRHGFKDTSLNTVRGLTIVPALTAKIDHRLGSLEPGKDADLLVLTGHPADPRTSVEQVLIEGRRVYDATEKRRW